LTTKATERKAVDNSDADDVL